MNMVSVTFENEAWLPGEVIYQVVQDCPVHLGPDRSFPRLDTLERGERVLALGNGRAGLFHPVDTWLQIDLDQWIPLNLDGQRFLARHILEQRD